jgi:hypothetical protein
MKLITSFLAFLVPISCYAFDPAAKTAAVRTMLEANGYRVRFESEVPQMVQFLRDNLPSGSEMKIAEMRKALTFDRFAQALEPSVGMFMTQADIETTNSFLSKGGGRKEAEFMVSLFIEIRDGKEKTENIPARRDGFYLSISEDDRAEIILFRDTEAGKRYWNMLGQVEKAYRRALGKVLKDATIESNR